MFGIFKNKNTKKLNNVIVEINEAELKTLKTEIIHIGHDNIEVEVNQLLHDFVKKGNK